jgi:ElaA protein
MPKIEMEWQRFAALTTGALYELLRFRQDIFVVEQKSPYPDLDGLDQSAWHLLLRVEGQLSGCLRLMTFPGPPTLVRIGRVAVASHLRRQGLGRGLMQEALRFCHEHHPTHGIVLSAQAHLVPAYQALGFEAIGQSYDDFGVSYIEMRAVAIGQPSLHR